MGFPSTQILDLIFQLLPGFVAAWIFYGLTAHPKRDSFERTVQALIFTGIVRGLVLPVKWLAIGIGLLIAGPEQLYPWSTEGEYLLSIGAGVVVGLACTYSANNNTFHDYIKKRIPKITKKTSFPSEWYSVFHQHACYIYLHLDREYLRRKPDEMDLRVFGWPEEWPDSPDSGQFVLMQAEWIAEDGTRTPLAVTERLIVPAKAVLLVEFEPEAACTRTSNNVLNAEELIARSAADLVSPVSSPAITLVEHDSQVGRPVVETAREVLEPLNAEFTNAKSDAAVNQPLLPDEVERPESKLKGNPAEVVATAK